MSFPRLYIKQILQTRKGEKMKKGTLSIEIDKLTACLEDANGNLLKTSAYKIEDKKVLKGFTKRAGWYANWSNLYEKYDVYALVLTDSPSVFQGLVAVENDDEAKVTTIQCAVASPENNPRISKNKKYYGVGGHLFAIALLASLKAGYGGVVVGHPSTLKLHKHYIECLGAEEFNASLYARNYQFTILLEGEKARKLYEKYTFDEIETTILQKSSKKATTESL